MALQTGFDQHVEVDDEVLASGSLPSPLDDAGEVGSPPTPMPDPLICDLRQPSIPRAVPGQTSLAWHTDQSFTLTPAQATVFFCVRCPDSGADTLFCNTADAWDRLPASLQNEAEGKVAVHVPGGRNGGTFQSGRAEGDATAHPLVREHPETGRRCLYLSPENTETVEGLGAAEGRALVQR